MRPARAWISPLAALLLWETLSRTGLLDTRFFPPPSEILHHLLFVSPEEGILRDLAATLSRIAWGFPLGAGLGVILGVAAGLSRPVKTAVFPLVALAYPLPKIAVLPLIMLIFGIGELSKIVVVAIGSFFLVFMNTLHGVERLPPIHHHLARVYRLRRRDLILRIVLPGAFPTLLTGLRLAIGYSLVIVVAAEFSGADAGLGYLVWQSWETFSIRSMYAGVFALGLLGLAFSLLLDWMEKRWVRWRG